MKSVQSKQQKTLSRAVILSLDSIVLAGELEIPGGATGVVMFAHGSGSSRLSPRNRYVAQVIREAGVGTLLFDLLTPEEEQVDQQTRHLRFNIPLLAGRLVAATEWVQRQPDIGHLCVGYFGASTGGGAALIAAATLSGKVGAVVSRGGRPDLAGDFLPQVLAPTLLIVGDQDDLAVRLNKEAFGQLQCTKELKIVPGTTRQYEKLEAQEEVSRLAADWFLHHLCEVADC